MTAHSGLPACALVNHSLQERRSSPVGVLLTSTLSDNSSVQGCSYTKLEGATELLADWLPQCGQTAWLQPASSITIDVA